MKCKSLLLCVAMFLSLVGHASTNRHTHKAPSDSNARSEMTKKMMMPGYCEIEIVNRSFEPVHVSGTFLDGDWLDAFDIYPYEYPHYISLQYWGCQRGMYLTITNFDGIVIYSGYTPVYQTITVYPLFGQKQSAVKMQPKAQS